MKGVVIMSPKNVEIGDHVFINKNSIISAPCGAVKIGSFCMISTNCNILTTHQGYKEYDKPMFIQDIFGGPIIIEDDVWIGANTVIMPNVKMGRGAIIGSNAVVVSDVDPYSIVGGIPAKFIKFRFDNATIELAKKINFGDYRFSRKKRRCSG